MNTANTQKASDLLAPYIVRNQVYQHFRRKHQLAPLDLAILLYIHTYTLGSPAHKDIIEAHLGTYRNAVGALQKLKELGYTEYFAPRYRAARKVKLTEKGKDMVNELSLISKRSIRQLKRGCT